MNDLDLSVKYVKGVGNKTLLYLNDAQIYTIKDLIYTLPKKYNIYEIKDFNLLNDEEIATIKGVVSSSIYVRKIRKSIDNVIFYVNANGNKVKIVAFGMGYLRYLLKPNMEIFIYGINKVSKKEFLAREIFTKPLMSLVDPVYSIKNISDSLMSKYIRSALVNSKLDETLPLDFIDKYRLYDINTYIFKSHFPSSKEDVIQVTRRKKYENYLRYSLELEALRYFVNINKKEPKILDKNVILNFVSKLPYELTNSQKLAINEIVLDSKKDIVMNRLIQGDVGSGKTIVAVVAMLLNSSLGYQSILMAPTEILANQHFKNISTLLRDFNFNIQILTSSTPAQKKEEIFMKLELGNIDILISTHSILYHQIRYKKLGLLVIDEQHRFGVNARMELLNQFPHTDAIYLSATPIPRTLGLTKFADMDISTMKERPANRKVIKTYVQNILSLDKIYSDIRARIKRNEQVFCVCTKIEDEESFDLGRVKQLLEENIDGVKVGIVYGGLKSEDKRKIMLDFQNKQYDVLVSTTVIEVGIDVKSATGIYIFNAERFGLSTLHQLRGRVGRNELEGACYFITNNPGSDRLNFLANTDDCFEIAEYDLNDRGPGEILGEAQSGYLGLDIKADMNIYKCAKEDAAVCFDRYLHNNLEPQSLCKLVETMALKKAKLN